MSLLARVKKHVAENNFVGAHPLLEMGMGRDICDAYFDGLVFASVADDEKVEGPERDYLAKVAQSLDIPEDEIDERIRNLTADPENCVKCGMEAVKTLGGKGDEVARLFLCEFTRVWSSHSQSKAELDEFRKQLSAWMHFLYDEKFFSIFDDVSAKAASDPAIVGALLDRLDDHTIRYLFSEIPDVENIFLKKREEEERAVLPHPLKNVLSEELKTHYLNVVRHAVEETSDNLPTKMQKNGLRHLGIALGVDGASAKTETISKIFETSFDSEKRNISFFLYIDIARLFAMDGHAEFSAVQQQKLEEVVGALMLAPEDAEFLGAYSVFVGNDKEADAAELVQHAQSSIRFPDGFIRYGMPNMKPIVLAGGDTKDGVYQIVEGRYRLEKTLKVGANTRLVIKNAVIDFAPEAQIELGSCVAEISDCEFNGEQTDVEDLIGKPFFKGDCASHVKFERCRFNGVGCRAVASIRDKIDVESCRFNRLCGTEGIPIISCHYNSIMISNSQWNDCRAKGLFFNGGSYGDSIEVVACDFVSCSAEKFMHTHYNKDIVCRACLFERCDFKEFREYNEMAENGSPRISDNHFDDKSSGDVAGLSSIFLRQSNCTIERLREVRVELGRV